jgi:hypothetical protein
LADEFASNADGLQQTLCLHGAPALRAEYPHDQLQFSGVLSKR